MALEIEYYKNKVRHQADAAARWTGGFAVRQLLNVLSGGGSVSLANKAHAAMLAAPNATPWAIIGSAPVAYSFGVVSLVLGAGVRGYLNHREMEYHKKELTHDFRKEIAAKLEKLPEEVTEADLEIVASQLPTLGDELKRKQKAMHLSTAAWAIGAVVSLVAVIGVVSMLPAAAGFLVSMMVGVAVGYVTHRTTEDIVETVGNNVMHLRERSPLDRIRKMEQGQQLGRKTTPEQVMSIHVSADPQLQQQILRDPELGKPFDRLPLAAKHKAILTYGKDLSILEVTDAINDNRMSARELAFRVHGENSNAYAEPTIYQKVQEKLSGIKQGLDNSRVVASKAWDGLVSRISSPKVDQAVAPEQKEWVKDLGLAPPVPMKDQLNSWGEQVMRQREQVEISPDNSKFH